MKVMSHTKSHTQRQLGRWLGVLAVAAVLIGSGADLFVTLPHGRLANSPGRRNALAVQITTHHNPLVLSIRDTQPQPVISVVKLGPALANVASPVPIVMYHKTPIDFEMQLQSLQLRGYTTVTLRDVIASFAHRSQLPLKSVVLTFDDGFADDMKAFTLLEKYHMKATFYIVNGGPISNWCIGASRRYDDPSQQLGGCGDVYLNWDQIRLLDQSGLITIGGHTIDHVDLATESPDAQRYEIVESKRGIEDRLGHPIYDFAYPYGSFNATTVSIVQQAGYTSAVTTLPGIYQDPAMPFMLRRIRSVQNLP